MAKSRRPALLVHFPRFRWPQPEPVDTVDPRKFDPILYAPFPPDLVHDYTADLDVLGKHLLPQYVYEDGEATRSQNEFRRDQVILIIGGVIATGLAALPGAVPGESGDTVRVVAALAAAALAAWASRSRDLASQERWRTSRLKAELLRGEYFLYLGRAKPYDVEGCRNRNLMRRVAEIRSGGAA
ncbi:DUF4231 domain-containing protein [Longimicrobium sp.]|uniref:DUF4231 domain-containing protein n=1 Tax=Longimicrobium sp. TaxID=2029185 RepID=UPI003B3AB2E6